jgi:putative superfamily III holin-X
MAGTATPEQDAPAADFVPDPFGRTWSDLAETLDLRRKLAEAELKSDVAASKRLAVVGSVGVVLALSGLPLLLTALAFQLAAVTNVGFAAWLAILGGPLFAVGLAVVFLAWRRFRREFLALATTRQELREDLLWLREWLLSSSTD